MAKILPLPVVKVSFTGFSPRTQDGVIIQVAASIHVDYAATEGGPTIEGKDETIYCGTFGSIVGKPMPQEVADALDVLSAHFAGLVMQEYGVQPS